jgi:NAD(P)-dependent dehydrogenase (short-subunit alcohol dehydrogenase family)
MYRAFASTPEAHAAVSDLKALGRVAQPEEVARAALFLASDASYV